MHARIENGKVIEYPVANLRQLFPNSSLPQDLTDDSLLPEGYAFVHDMGWPEYDTDTQSIVPMTPTFEGGRWVKRYEVCNLTPQEILARAETATTQVRAERNQLLTASDWTQVADAPVDKLAWAAYRQVLRDVTAQPGFPFDVQWPVAPDHQ